MREFGYGVGIQKTKITFTLDRRSIKGQICLKLYTQKKRDKAYNFQHFFCLRRRRFNEKNDSVYARLDLLNTHTQC